MARYLPTLALALSTATILAAGCQPEPPINIEPTAEPSSQTPTPKKPTLPTKAENDDYAGAVAFVEHYYELAKYGEQTGNWNPQQSASSPKCEGCEGFWKSSPDRRLVYSSVEANDPSLNDLIDGVAQVNVTMEDRNRKTEDGDFPLSWLDVVKCTFEDGSWKVISIESKSY